MVTNESSFAVDLSYFLCATLRLAGSSSTTNTPSFLPADTEVGGGECVRSVGSGR